MINAKASSQNSMRIQNLPSESESGQVQNSPYFTLCAIFDLVSTVLGDFRLVSGSLPAHFLSATVPIDSARKVTLRS